MPGAGNRSLIKDSATVHMTDSERRMPMKLMPHGDYYVWECDWCVSLNRTLWTRVEEGNLVCGVCKTDVKSEVTGQLAECA
jgi:hypothetical protein